MSGTPASNPILSNKTVLLTGGNGFVGSRVAARLLGFGCRIRAIVRNPGQEPALRHERVTEIEGDFVDPAVTAPAARGANVVIHCAATSGPEVEPVRRVNTEGTRVVCGEALSAHCERYVQISTGSVYDRAHHAAVDETTPLKESGDPYGLTKAEGDRVVLDFMKRGLAAVILRPGAIIGLHRTSTWAVRIPEMVRDGKVKLRGDGEDIIPYVHVENFVDAIVLAITSPAAVGHVYDVVDGQVTWRTYTDEVRRWFELPELERIPMDQVQPGTYWKGVFESRRIRDELGYRPRLTYDQGMSDARSHWRNAQTSARAV
jgi:nucleoside-diphosphate-sugar epimerase